MTNESPTLQTVIQKSIHSQLLDVHTCMPGIVDSVDHEKKSVIVQPSLKRKYIEDEEPVSFPLLVDVPIGFMQTKTSIISVPIKKGG